MRFILNLKDLNCFLSPPHFQSEDWRMVAQLMTQDSWMSTLDLQDAYLLVSIAQESRHFLRCQWRGVTYELTALHCAIHFYKNYETSRDKTAKGGFLFGRLSRRFSIYQPITGEGLTESES